MHLFLVLGRRVQSPTNMVSIKIHHVGGEVPEMFLYTMPFGESFIRYVKGP